MTLQDLCEKFEVEDTTLYDGPSGAFIADEDGKHDEAREYEIVSEIIESSGNFFCVVQGPSGDLDLAYFVDEIRLDRDFGDCERENDINGQLRDWIEDRYPLADTSVFAT